MCIQNVDRISLHIVELTVTPSTPMNAYILKLFSTYKKHHIQCTYVMHPRLAFQMLLFFPVEISHISPQYIFLCQYSLWCQVAVLLDMGRAHKNQNETQSECACIPLLYKSYLFIYKGCYVLRKVLGMDEVDNNSLCINI